MIHNLTQYTAVQHQQAAIRQLENLENQRKIQDLVSTNHGNMLMLHTGLGHLSSSVNSIQRQLLRSLRRRPKPLEWQPIAETEFEKTFAQGEYAAAAQAIEIIPDEERFVCMNHRAAIANLESIRGNEDSGRSDSSYQLPYQLERSDSICQQCVCISNQARIIDHRWKSLGAWLSVVTYQESRYQTFPHLPSLSHTQKQTVLDITMMSRAISVRLQFTYGDFQGTNSLSVSLSTPRILNNDDKIFVKIFNVPLTEFTSFYREGNYCATDMDENQNTLLCVSRPLHTDRQPTGRTANNLNDAK